MLGRLAGTTAEKLRHVGLNIRVAHVPGKSRRILACLDITLLLRFDQGESIAKWIGDRATSSFPLVPTHSSVTMFVQ